jgi:prefoldin subunit 5
VFDVAKLTLDEVGEEIDKTIDKLSRLQSLYSAMLAQDNRRVKKLIEQYNAAQAAAKETKDDTQHRRAYSVSRPEGGPDLG